MSIAQENIKQPTRDYRSRCKALIEHFERLNNYPTHVPPTKVCDINNNNISSGKSVNNASFTRGPSFNYDIEQFQCSVENASMSRITPFLYLGNELDAKNVCKLAKEGIFYILNVSREIPFYGDLLPASSASTPSSRNQFVLKRIAVNDSSNQNLLAHFEEAIEFIDAAVSNNSKVLVHCQAGISRSSTIVIAYLMNKTRLKMNDAFSLVSEKRPIVAPNLEFLGQLMDYEAQLFNTQSAQIQQQPQPQPPQSQSQSQTQAQTQPQSQSQTQPPSVSLQSKPSLQTDPYVASVDSKARC